MAVTQYIGSRYVPLFADPLDWNDQTEYEPLTIVYYAGNSYTSRQHVPKGIQITNTDYWALTGNYNAQIEQYRQEVQNMQDDVQTNTADISEVKQQAAEAQQSATTAQQSATTAQTNANKALQQVATKAQINHASADATYGAASDTMYGHAKLYNAKGSNVDGSMTQAAITEALGNVVTKVNTDDIYDNAVTTDKIADGAVTASKLDSSSVTSILNGMQIRFFDSNDPSADNDGLQTISGVWISGLYIVQLEMLVLTRYMAQNVEISDTDANITLPNYVKRPAARMDVAASLIIYAPGQDYKSWTGLVYETNGSLHPASSIATTDSCALFGTQIMCMRNTAQSLANNPVNNYYAQNGVYHG